MLPRKPVAIGMKLYKIIMLGGLKFFKKCYIIYKGGKGELMRYRNETTEKTNGIVYNPKELFLGNTTAHNVNSRCSL